MSTTILTNPGLVEIAALTTMGASVKDGDNPIGYFGTGFKYAIAVLLRNGHGVRVLRGAEEFRFAANTEVIRGQDFQVVYLHKPDGSAVSLNFTTDMGKNWELWMAFRELYSNMLDEGGEMIVDAKQVTALPGDTQVIVEGNDFMLQAKNKHLIFLQGAPILKNANGNFEVHRGSTNHLYYKGVRAFDWPNEMAYRYNFRDGLTLTEDRTIKQVSEAQSIVGMFVSRECEDEDFMEDFLSAGEGTWEHQCECNWFGITETFYSVMRRLIHSKGNQHLNPSAVAAYNNRQKKLQDDVGIELDEMMASNFERAGILLEKMGFQPERIRWTFVNEIGYGNAYGASGSQSFKLSRKAFDGGAPVLAAHMLEAILQTQNANTFRFSVTQGLARLAITLGQKLCKEYI